MLLGEFGISYPSVSVNLIYESLKPSRRMPISVRLASRIATHIDVLIQRLRVTEIRIRHRDRRGAPVRREKSAKAIAVVPGAKIVAARFIVSFMATIFVVVGIIGRKL
jgi:hypothetical protein